ncbi:MAG: hypothetical protein H6R00_2876 [Proteobacteria bacterium]|nr:hypothetical protein [Pseudomonadota bacterium]
MPDRNPVVDLANISTRLMAGETADHALKATVVFGPGEVQDEEGEHRFTVVATRAFLKVKPEGMTTCLGSELGNDDGLVVAKEKKTVKTSVGVEGTVGAELDLAVADGVPIKPTLAGSAKGAYSAEREFTQERSLPAVKYRGSEMWELCEPSENGKERKPLNRPLIGGRVLLELEADTASNRRTAHSQLSVYQRDLDFKGGWLNCLSRNQKKLFGILAAKTLTKEPALYSGTVVLASSEVGDGDA